MDLARRKSLLPLPEYASLSDYVRVMPGGLAYLPGASPSWRRRKGTVFDFLPRATYSSLVLECMAEAPRRYQEITWPVLDLHYACGDVKVELQRWFVFKTYMWLQTFHDEVKRVCEVRPAPVTAASLRGTVPVTAPDVEILAGLVPGVPFKSQFQSRKLEFLHNNWRFMKDNYHLFCWLKTASKTIPMSSKLDPAFLNSTSHMELILKRKGIDTIIGHLEAETQIDEELTDTEIDDSFPMVEISDSDSFPKVEISDSDSFPMVEIDTEMDSDSFPMVEISDSDSDDVVVPPPPKRSRGNSMLRRSVRIECFDRFLSLLEL